MASIVVINGRQPGEAMQLGPSAKDRRIECDGIGEITRNLGATRLPGYRLSLRIERRRAKQADAVNATHMES